MVQISRRDLELLAVGFGIADFLSEGRLTKPISKATKAALKKAAPAIARGIVKYGPRVATTAARVTPGPVAAAALGATAFANRRRIADAAGNIYEEVAPAVSEYGAGVLERAQDPGILAPMEPRDLFPFDVIPRARSPRQKRKTTKFNQAIKKGMSIVKQSTSYGKKGTINNAKKAFSAVTKAASAVSKGRKAPKSGIKRKLHQAMSKILPKKKKTKQTGKTKYKITVNR